MQAFAVLVIFNYLSVMSSANVFSLKMSFYSALKIQVNQDRYESSPMMLHTGISQHRYSFVPGLTEVGEAETESFTRFR